MKLFLTIHKGLFAVLLLFAWGCGESTNQQPSTRQQGAKETRQVDVIDRESAGLTQVEKDLQVATEESQGREVVQTDQTEDDKMEKAEVDSTINAARAALIEAEELLMKAPTGKDSELTLQMMENDIRSAESMLSEVTKEIEPQDYLAVKDKARKAKDVADRVREQILHAMRKAEDQGL